MDTITKEDYDRAASLPEVKRPEVIGKITDEDFKALLNKLEHPVEVQKELAVQVKRFLDHHINRELRDKGVLSEFTRRWVSEYNEILDRIQKSLFGDKSVNLHLHKISHSHIASQMRKYGSKP